MNHILKYNETRYWNKAVNNAGKNEVNEIIEFINHNIEYFNHSDFNKKYDNRNSRSNFLNIPYPQLIHSMLYKIKNFKNPNLSNTDLSILYAIYDYIKENIEKYGEIEDCFLEWLDEKRWEIEKNGLGSFTFIVDSKFTNLSNFFIDLDQISKRHNLTLDIINIGKSMKNSILVNISAKKP